MNREKPNSPKNPTANAKIPKHFTVPARGFFSNTMGDLDFFHFIIDVVLRTDFVSHTARHVLEGNEFPKDLSPTDLAVESPGIATKFLRRHKQALLEMFLTRQIDNFTTYLSEIIREALLARPKMLRSREQVQLDYALSFNSLDEFRTDLIDRKVADLSYLGFTDLCAWAEDRMGVELVSTDDTKANVVEFIETRNAIIHNRGRIGEKYLRIVPSTTFKKDERRVLDVDYLFECHNELIRAVTSIDRNVGEKFGLKLVTGFENEVGEDAITDPNGKSA